MKLVHSDITSNEQPEKFREPHWSILSLCQDAMQARLVDLLHSIIQVRGLFLPETTNSSERLLTRWGRGLDTSKARGGWFNLGWIWSFPAEATCCVRKFLFWHEIEQLNALQLLALQLGSVHRRGNRRKWFARSTLDLRRGMRYLPANNPTYIFIRFSIFQHATCHSPGGYYL